MDIERLELKLSNVKKNKEFLGRERELLIAIVPIKKAAPKTLNANFEFETTPEFIEHIKVEYDFQLDKQMFQMSIREMELDIEIKDTEKQIEKLKGVELND